MVYFPRPDLETVVAFQRVSQFDVPRTHATRFSRPFDGTTIGSDRRRDLDQFRTLGYLQLTWFPGAQWLRRAHLSLSYQLQEEEEQRTRDNGRRSSDRVCDGTYGLLLQLESPSPLGQLSVENFTDVDYRLHGSGSNESGVDAIVGFDWRL